MTVRSLVSADASRLLALLDEERSAFDPWLRWSGDVRTLEVADRFVADAMQGEQSNNGFHLGVRLAGELVGGIACWSIDATSRIAEVGYWLAIAFRRRGIAETAARRVIEYLFRECDVRGVELQCLTENLPSRRLAERLGGSLVRVHRPPVSINGTQRDHALYAIASIPSHTSVGGSAAQLHE